MTLFTIYGLFTKMLYDGDGRKTPKYTKNETKVKIPGLVALHPLVYEVEVDCPKTPKTSRTYPKWERVPNLMGQKKKGLDTAWSFNDR